MFIPPTNKYTAAQIIAIAALVMVLLYALAVITLMQFDLRCGAMCGQNVFMFVIKGFAR